MSGVGTRAVVVLALLVPVACGHSAGANSPVHHAKAVARDLEIEMDPVKSGMAILGAVCGAAMGIVTGASTMAQSRIEPEAQDAARHMLAGLLAGGVVGWIFDHKRCDQKEWTWDERAELAKRGMERGAMLGAVAGALGLLVSGSCDEDGPSGSVSSLSSSSGNDKPDEDKAEEERRGTLASMGDIPTIHNAIAGALAGASFSFAIPEMCTIAKIVGSGALAAANKGEMALASKKGN